MFCLVFQGYACAWRKLLTPVTSKSGSVTDTNNSAGNTVPNASNSGTGNNGEEMKDLWIFYFTELPDLSASVSSELRGNDCLLLPLNNKFNYNYLVYQL